MQSHTHANAHAQDSDIKAKKLLSRRRHRSIDDLHTFSTLKAMKTLLCGKKIEKDFGKKLPEDDFENLKS